LTRAGAAAVDRPWALLAMALAGAALCTAALGWIEPGADALLDWQQALAWQQPWRWWTAAFVHLGALHLLANVLGCGVLAMAGVSARLPLRAAAAWALAWPLSHLALLASPELQRYAGLSGVLHAGVAVLAVELIVARRGRDRRVGLALATGLALKLLLEQAWVRPVSVGGAWPFPVATFAHLTGVAAGAACAALAIPWAARSCTDEATLRGGPTPSERRQP
jgi:rhomboid family GlyGly-CTERM serine protease